jgi:tetratricopeptide (TPR) repeat protein
LNLLNKKSIGINVKGITTMNKFSQILVVLSFFINISGLDVSAQSSSDLVQTGMNHYNKGDYENALTTFNSALAKTQQSESLAGDSREESVSVSNETDVSVTDESYVETSKEDYVGVSQESTISTSTEKYMSEPLKYQGEDQSSIYLYRGRTHLQMGNKEAALKDFDKAIELNPTQSDAYFRRALINTNVDPDKVCPDLLDAISNGHESAKELYELVCK